MNLLYLTLKSCVRYSVEALRGDFPSYSERRGTKTKIRKIPQAGVVNNCKLIGNCICKII